MLEGLDFGAIFTAGGLAKLGQIIVGDLTMAGDNVVIMGSLASGLPSRDRRKVLLFGVGMALVFLIAFAVLATQLLKITGLVFAGGLLLLWLVTLPLARSMARQRERLLRRAIDASEQERRRIAADLHDGVVQDLVGVSYSLSAEADRVGDNGARTALRTGASQARRRSTARRPPRWRRRPPSAGGRRGGRCR